MTDTCRPVIVDGHTVLVRGSDPMDADEIEMFADVVRAVTRRYDAEHHTPAPAGVSAAPTSRDRPIGPAGAPIPTTSEEQCERCGRILDCCRRCPTHEGDVE